MPRWMKPSEEMPEVEVGDRIAIIVRERTFRNKPFRLRLVILEATETSWRSIEDNYSSYTPGDGELWAYERDVCAIADVVGGTTP